MIPQHEIMTDLLNMRKLRKRFIAWIVSECHSFHPKNNQLAFARSLELKMGGATRATMQKMAERNGYCNTQITLFS